MADAARCRTGRDSEHCKRRFYGIAISPDVFGRESLAVGFDLFPFFGGLEAALIKRCSASFLAAGKRQPRPRTTCAAQVSSGWRGWYFVWILSMRKSCILRAAYLALGLIYRLIGFRFMCYALFAETKGTSLQTISAHRLHHSIPGSRFHDE